MTCALLGFGLMIAAALDLRPANDQQLLTRGIGKVILGGWRWARRCGFRGSAARAGQAARRCRWTQPPPLVVLRAGSATLVMLTAINGQVLHIVGTPRSAAGFNSRC